MSAFRDMAHDGGYRGDEADQVATMLEQQEHDRIQREAELERDEIADECAAHGHPIVGGSTCRCGENHL